MSDAPSPSLPQFDALRQANLARAKEWNPTGADTGPGFAGLELAGEVGELCNLLKKAERARLGLVGGSVSPAAIAEELADVVICADLVGLALGLDLWPIVVTKFNATSEAKGFATRLGERISLPVARFKDAGHPATAAGEAAEPTPEQIGERLADIKNADFRSAAITRAMVDQLSTLLGMALRCLSKEALSDWITQLEADIFGQGRNTLDRIQANAMLVGILTVMLGQIETAKLERGAD